VADGVAPHEEHHARGWDATILAATEELGAPILYSEVRNREQVFGSAKVVNPFLPN